MTQPKHGNQEPKKLLPTVTKIHHESPFTDSDYCRMPYILLPYGYEYNSSLKYAAEGDRIRFLNGDEAEILSTCAVQLKSKLAGTLCAMRYGHSLVSVMAAWRNTAQIMGHKASIISEDVCLLVYHSSRFIKERKP